MVRILFVCKHNRFRSQIAESYFRKINKNKNIKFYSAGIIIGIPIASAVKQVGRKLGLKINGKPKGIKESLLKEINLLIIVANDIPAYLFKKKVKKIIVWKIPDTSQIDLDKIEKISRRIIKKVDKLNNKLEKGK